MKKNCNLNNEFNSTILSEEKSNSLYTAKEFMTLKEAAGYTGIGINRLRKMSDDKNCDFVLFVGTKRMFKVKKLVAFLNNSYSI